MFPWFWTSAALYINGNEAVLFPYPTPKIHIYIRQSTLLPRHKNVHINQTNSQQHSFKG